MTTPARRTVDLLADLEEAGAVVNNGLFLPADIPYEQYEALGVMLGKLHTINRWLIGDWLLYGEHTYGHKYAQASELLNLSESTLENYASIAKRVPPGRRSETVSFTLQGELAALPADRQRYWLDVIEKEGLKKIQLRDRLREAGELPPAVVRWVTCPHCGGEVQL